MKLVKTLALLGGLCVLTACPHQSDDPNFVIVNNSERDISLYVAMDYANDTLFCDSYSGHVQGYRLFAKHGETTVGEDHGRNGMRTLVREIEGVLTLLVVDDELRIKYSESPCDTFYKYVPIIHRYQYMLHELDQMN